MLIQGQWLRYPRPVMQDHMLPLRTEIDVRIIVDGAAKKQRERDGPEAGTRCT